MKNSNKPKYIAAFLSVACTLAAATSQAAVITAASLTGPVTSAGGQGGRTSGWAFTPTSDISVTALGLLDLRNQSGFKFGLGLADAHPIGIWDEAQPASPIVSSIVPAGTTASLVDNIRFVPIAPTLLLSGTTYVIGAHYPTHTDLLASTGISYDPLAGAGAPEAQISLNPSALEFPDLVFNGSTAHLGPTFQFTAVPEPSATAMVLVGLGVAGAHRRRRIRRAA